eukprot:COSAG04_NODE_9585_length_850_cov_0.780293_1_plen_80_part_10
MLSPLLLPTLGLQLRAQALPPPPLHAHLLPVLLLRPALGERHLPIVLLPLTAVRRLQQRTRSALQLTRLCKCTAVLRSNP